MWHAVQRERHSPGKWGGATRAWAVRDLPPPTGADPGPLPASRGSMTVRQGIGRIAGRAMSRLRAGEDHLAWHDVARSAPRALEVTSSSFTDGAELPRSATADGDGVAIPLSWANVPEETRSLVVVCEDPDAPLPEPFVHWIVVGIPKDASGIGRGASFVEGMSSAATVGFTPAAPPLGHGVHHYHFQVFALDVAPELPRGVGRRQVLDAVRGHVVAWGDLVGTYQRS